MPPQDLAISPETPRDQVEIRDDHAISVQQALAFADANSVRIGKSTLQRWAKHWALLGTSAPVKSLLLTNRDGKFYRLDRSDFEAWILEQEPNAEPPKISSDPERSHEIPQDPTRSHRVSRDPERPQETSDQQTSEIAKLRDENMQLKIDLEVRKQLLSKAVEQSHQQGEKIESLLRENGALGWRLVQLEPPAQRNDRETGEDQAKRETHTVVVENLNNRQEPGA